MEKDNWKSWIDQHKEAFDSEAPQEDVWFRIEAGMQRRAPRMVRLSSVIRVAAMLVVGLGISFSVWFHNADPQLQQQMAEVGRRLPHTFVLSGFSPEYAELEHYYVSRIEATRRELKAYQPDEDLLASVAALDEEFFQLSKEMQSSVNRREIIEALVENYRLKLALLEQLLESLKAYDNENAP